MARGVLAGWRRAVSRQWTSGLRCCARRSRKTTTGSTMFWPRWNTERKEDRNEQTDIEERRRYTHRGDQALRRGTRGCLSRAYRSDAGSEMDARPGWVEHAALYQRGEA